MRGVTVLEHAFQEALDGGDLRIGEEAGGRGLFDNVSDGEEGDVACDGDLSLPKAPHRDIEEGSLFI